VPSCPFSYAEWEASEFEKVLQLLRCQSCCNSGRFVDASSLYCSYMLQIFNIVMCMSVTRDRVWIGDSTHCTNSKAHTKPSMSSLVVSW
jgi:hypothetical protein